MPTQATATDAELILKLYDLRREAEIRKARNWWLTGFWPESADDVYKIGMALGSQENNWLRQVGGYWEMAASLVHHGAPPFILDVALQLDAQRTVVIRAAQTAVDLRALEDEAAPFAQVDDGVVIGNESPQQWLVIDREVEQPDLPARVLLLEEGVSADADDRGLRRGFETPARRRSRGNGFPTGAHEPVTRSEPEALVVA